MIYAGYGNPYPVWEECGVKRGCQQSCVICFDDPCRCQPCKFKSLCNVCDYDPCQCRSLCNVCNYDPCRCQSYKYKSLCNVCNYDPCRCTRKCECDCNPCRCPQKCHICRFDPCRCRSKCNTCNYDPCRCRSKCNTCNTCNYDPCRCVSTCTICRFDPCRCKASCQCTICVRKVNFVICWFIDDNHCKGKAEQLVKSTIFKLDYLWRCRVICRREFVVKYGVYISAIQRLNNELKDYPCHRRYYDLLLEYICLLNEYILESTCVDVFIICQIIKKFRKALESCKGEERGYEREERDCERNEKQPYEREYKRGYECEKQDCDYECKNKQPCERGYKTEEKYCEPEEKKTCEREEKRGYEREKRCEREKWYEKRNGRKY